MTDALAPEVMDPCHPRWGDFCGRVTRALVGRMFTTARSKLEIMETGTWACTRKHQTDPFRHARVMLREFGMAEDASITLFKDCGARCDCQLVFDQRWMTRAEAYLDQR